MILRNPDDLYGLMHLTREQIIKKYLIKKILILRPTIMYGLGIRMDHMALIDL